MGKDKRRHTIWLTDSAWDEVKTHYHQDNCEAQNEFIEKAIRFYCGYLNTKSTGAYLPRVLSDVLEGKLGMLGSRIGRLLFKLTVDESIMAHIIAADTDIDQTTLEKLRGRCVQDAKRTNGEINFSEILQFQKEL